MLRSLLVVTSFVLAVTTSVTVRAESASDAGLYCTIAAAPTGGVSVPANFPALRVLRGSDVTSVTVKQMFPESPAVSFRSVEQGTFTYLYPSAQLAVGAQYRVDFDFDCSRGTALGVQPMTFQTTEPMPLPTKIGTAQVGDEGSSTILVIDPTPELKAYLALVDFELFENGALLPAYRLQRADGKIRFSVSPASTTCLEDDDLVREKTVRVSARVMGAATYPESLEAPMLFDCRKASRATKPPATKDDDDGGGGCQASPYSASSAFFGGLLTVMAVGVWRRRARRRANELDRVRPSH